MPITETQLDEPMPEKQARIKTAPVAIHFFHGSPDLGKGNIKQGSTHEPDQLVSLMDEALSYGLDVQVLQPRSAQSNTILYVSPKGFSQR